MAANVAATVAGGATSSVEVVSARTHVAGAVVAGSLAVKFSATIEWGVQAKNWGFRSAWVHCGPRQFSACICLGTDAQIADYRPQSGELRALWERRGQVNHSAWECGFRPALYTVLIVSDKEEVPGSSPGSPTRRVPCNDGWFERFQGQLFTGLQIGASAQ